MTRSMLSRNISHEEKRQKVLGIEGKFLMPPLGAVLTPLY